MSAPSAKSSSTARFSVAPMYVGCPSAFTKRSLWLNGVAGAGGSGTGSPSGERLAIPRRIRAGSVESTLDDIHRVSRQTRACLVGTQRLFEAQVGINVTKRLSEQPRDEMVTRTGTERIHAPAPSHAGARPASGGDLWRGGQENRDQATEILATPEARANARITCVGVDRPFVDLGFARVDTDREARQGAPEAIFAEGKTPEEIAGIARALLDGGASSVLVTRADEDARAALRSVAPDAEEDERARLAWVARDVPEPHGVVTIVSGGTSDGPVVREAQVRAELLGTTVVVHRDAGVAGLHRLEPALEDLRRADCVIVVAGWDAALASVVGGLVAAPVIGVPTSTGYGATFGGVSALLAMMTSCAAGVAVVNIDDGFGAGTIAARIARRSA